MSNQGYWLTLDIDWRKTLGQSSRFEVFWRLALYPQSFPWNREGRRSTEKTITSWRNCLQWDLFWRLETTRVITVGRMSIRQIIKLTILRQFYYLMWWTVSLQKQILGNFLRCRYHCIFAAGSDYLNESLNNCNGATAILHSFWNAKRLNRVYSIRFVKLKINCNFRGNSFIFKAFKFLKQM